jgi:hypothetical protein
MVELISVFSNVYLIKNIFHRNIFKNSLKIPEGSPESVNRRTDNAMAKRKRRKGQTMIYNILHIKLKIE